MVLLSFVNTRSSRLKNESIQSPQISESVMHNSQNTNQTERIFPCKCSWNRDFWCVCISTVHCVWPVVILPIRQPACLSLIGVRNDCSSCCWHFSLQQKILSFSQIFNLWGAVTFKTHTLAYTMGICWHRWITLDYRYRHQSPWDCKIWGSHRGDAKDPHLSFTVYAVSTGK